MKTCACTGVRWCASCRDPRIRELHRMDDPVQIPDLLSTRPPDPASAPNASGRIHDFDLDLQAAPRCPAFQGVHVFCEFFSTIEAESILRTIDESAFDSAQSGKHKQHHGPKINFNKQRINAAPFLGIPEYAREIESRLRELMAQNDPEYRPDIVALRTALESFETTDVFVLRYLERNASNLDFHQDDTFAYGEMILDLSLESDSVLTFLNRAESELTTGSVECVRVPLPARSLTVLYGHARFFWSHAILEYDIVGRRTSVTLRTLNPSLHESEAGSRVLRIARGDRTLASF